MLNRLLGFETRAATGPSFTAADYERLVLSDPDFTFKTTAEEAMSIAAVWQVIGLLSGNLAELPLQKMRRDADGRDVVHMSHPTWDIVHEKPTPNMGAFKWWRRFWVQTLLWSNGYARINRDGLGRPRSLTLLESAMVTHAADENGETGYWYLNTAGQFSFARADNVVHVEDLALHKTQVQDRRIKPIRAIEQAKSHFNLNSMVEKYGTLFFEHGGRMGGWLELPAGMTKQAKKSYEDKFRDTYEKAESMFRIIIHRGAPGVKFVPASQAKPEETQMVEARKEQVRDTARWWGVPPHKLGDDTRIAYNSLEQEEKAYLKSTLSPRLCALADECKCKLLLPFERASGRHFYKHDVSGIVQVDQATATENAVKSFTNALIMKNEARAMIGLQPVDGGDEFMTPLNMRVGEQDQEQEEQDQEQEEDDLRFVRLPLADALKRALESMDRMCARKAKQMTPTGFANWLGNQLEEANEKSVRDKLRASVAAYAGASRQSEKEIFDRLFSCLCAEIRKKAQKNTRLEPQAASLLLLERIENAYAEA